MMRKSIKTYQELVRFPTFEERFQYAIVEGAVGEMTFGGHRILNQSFYRSSEWKRVRDAVIVRDSGCDLAIPGLPIIGEKIVIHHLNPIELVDLDDAESLLNLDYLVCVSHQTHNALHYGSMDSLLRSYTPRFQNDTCPWKL